MTIKIKIGGTWSLETDLQKVVSSQAASVDKRRDKSNLYKKIGPPTTLYQKLHCLFTKIQARGQRQIHRLIRNSTSSPLSLEQPRWCSLLSRKWHHLSLPTSSLEPEFMTLLLATPTCPYKSIFFNSSLIAFHHGA